MEVAVYEKDGVLKTSSTEIALDFSKQHKNVLQMIENLNCSPEFHRLNFQPITYLDGNGRTQKAMEMTRNGFMFLVMGFTGKRAGLVKEAFIKRFDEMERVLKNGTQDLTPSEALLLQVQNMVAIERKTKEIASRVKVLEAKQTIDPEFYAVTGYAALIGRTVTRPQAAVIGRKCSKLSTERGLPMDKAHHPVWGTVKTYHKDILKQIFESWES